MTTIEELLAKWKQNKWEYTIHYVDGAVKVTIGVMPQKHTQAKYAVGIGEDDLEAMQLADTRAEETLAEWNRFEKDIREMGERRFPRQDEQIPPP